MPVCGDSVFMRKGCLIYYIFRQSSIIFENIENKIEKVQALRVALIEQKKIQPSHLVGIVS
jgi:hypothetical protein